MSQNYTVTLTDEQSLALESRALLCNPEINGNQLLQHWITNTPDTIFTAGGPGERLSITSP